MDKLQELGLAPNMDLETSKEELRLTLQQLRNTILSAKINYGLKYRSDICWCGEQIKKAPSLADYFYMLNEGYFHD